MNAFVTNLMKSDKAQYDRLVELMRFYNMLDVDLRLILQLKTVFVTKESPEPIKQLPLAAFKDTMKSVFKHYRQADEIVQKTGECVYQETESNGLKQKIATSSKLNQLIEFMKCFPILVKRDKNNSSGMDFVMQKN